MNKNNSLTFSLVILISGLVIGGGIYLSRTNLLNSLFVSDDNIVVEDKKIQPISENDHILGNPDADIIVIEYSDYECPYCQEFHSVMNRIINEYGQQGRIAWIYRHMPIERVHVNARRIALTSECVADIRGNKAFWDFSDKIFENSPESLLKKNSDQILEEMSIDPQEIESCIERPEIISRLENDIEDGEYLQSIDKEFGTPYNIIITKTGLTENISGVIPYNILKNLIEQHSITF